MNDVLVISENRDLLKKIDSFFEYQKEIEFHMLPFSINAYEEFVSIRPDIVLIDDESVRPYKSLVNEFNSTSIDYKVIVLTSDSRLLTSEFRSMFFNKNDLSLNLLRQKIFNLLEERTHEPSHLDTRFYWKGVELEFSDFNNSIIVLIKYYGDEPLSDELLDHVKKHLSDYGCLEKYISDRNNLFFSVSDEKKDMFKLKGYLQKIMLLLDNRSSIVFIRNIKHYNEAFSQKLMLLDQLSYFTSTRVLPDEYFYIGHETLIKDSITNALTDLLKYTLEGDSSMVSNLVKELYLRQIKTSLNMNSLRFVSVFMSVFFDLFDSMHSSETSKITDFKCLEDEYVYVKECLLKYCLHFKNNQVSRVVFESLVYLFKNYRVETSLNDASKAVKINKIYLSRKIKQETNRTYLDILQTHRVKIANYYLEYTDLKIHEVASCLGYRDAHYFGRVYKKMMKVTPKSYRISKRGCIESAL